MGWNEVEQAFNDAVEERVIPGATVVVRLAATDSAGHRRIVLRSATLR